MAAPRYGEGHRPDNALMRCWLGYACVRAVSNALERCCRLCGLDVVGDEGLIKSSLNHIEGNVLHSILITDAVAPRDRLIA